MDANLENMSKAVDMVTHRLDTFILKDGGNQKNQAQQPSIQVKQSMKEPNNTNASVAKLAELEADLKGVKKDLAKI
jgi:hypothetical protein